MFNIALDIINGFAALHLKGLSYQDLNMGGFCFKTGNAGEGSALICDNDNVAPGNLGIMGFPGFMAPEVVLGKSSPNTNTDNYSLAVLLYHLFIHGHPLQGNLTLEKYPVHCVQTERSMYGSKALFSYHPTDKRNRPSKKVHGVVHKCWDMYPVFFREAFGKSFTLGLHDPARRLTSKDWSELIVSLRNSVIIKDGKERFVDSSNPSKLPQGTAILRINRNYKISDVVLSHGSRLYANQTTKDSLNYKKITAKVAENKSKPGILAMLNDSDSNWKYSAPGVAEQIIPKGGIIEISKGTKLCFEQGEAEVTFTREK